MKSATLHGRACADAYGNLTKDKPIATPALLLVSCAELHSPAGIRGALVGPAGRLVLACFCGMASKSNFSTAKYRVHPQAQVHGKPS